MMEEDQIIEIWDIFKEYMSDKNKEMAANHYVDFLLGRDVEQSVLQSVMGYDSFLDEAIKLVSDDTDESTSDDEDDYSYDENED
jgi:thiaminase